LICKGLGAHLVWNMISTKLYDGWPSGRSDTEGKKGLIGADRVRLTRVEDVASGLNLTDWERLGSGG